jgi:hypothetical protein
MTHSPNRDLFLDQITTSLKQRGLHTVALTLLEAGQPLVFVGGQLLWLAQPALGLFWPTERLGQIAQLMEDPAALHSLMHRLGTDEAAL